MPANALGYLSIGLTGVRFNCGVIEGGRADNVIADQAFAEFAAHASATIPFLEVEPLPDFSADGPVEIEALRSIRRKVARKMVTSMSLVPHVAHMDDADVTELDKFRVREKEKRAGGSGGKLTLLAFVIKAITAGLKAAPAFNASLDPFREEIIYKKYYNIGFAADTGRGLVVPVIKGTDRKSIRDISAEIAEKAGQAREGTLPAEDMRGGTFTITNVGPLGGTAMLPTINYPEVAILAMGKVHEKPVVRDGEIVIRKMLPLTLAFDHRVADGADAARFVTGIVRLAVSRNRHPAREGYGHIELSAARLEVRRRDATAMVRDDPLDYRQADAGPAGLRADVRLED